MSTYYVSVDVDLVQALNEDEIDDVLVALEGYGGVLSHRDNRLGVSLAVDVDKIEDAWPSAWKAVSAALPVGVERVKEVKVQDEQARTEEIERPLIPPLVGYAEIAEIAGVSRQRARQLDGSPGFPVPVVRTAAGPLRTRAAVESWAKRRTRKPGRPRKRQTADA